MISSVTVIAVGKLKEKFFAEACAEYEKRLSRFCKIKIIELGEHRLPDKPSRSAIEAALAAEAEEISAKIPPQAKVIALAVEGRGLSSEELTEKLEKYALDGAGSVCFLIGGSHGLDEALKARCEKISFSRMTFPHHLARIMLLEQIYRAYMISGGHSYHK